MILTSSLRLFVSRSLADEAELRLLPDPSRDPHVLHRRRLEVFQVLLKGQFVELRQELGLDRDVEATDVVDELTFGHGYNTFQKGVELAVGRGHRLESASRFASLETFAQPAIIG